MFVRTMFMNESKQHLVKECSVGNMVYIEPSSDFCGGGWAMVTKITLRDKDGLPEVVDVYYPDSGRKSVADQFMITEIL